MGHASHGRSGHGSPARDRIARKAASILELEGKETLTVDEIHTGARLVMRDGKDGENTSLCIPSFPGAEPSALRHIKIHSIHGLH